MPASRTTWRRRGRARGGRGRRASRRAQPARVPARSRVASVGGPSGTASSKGRSSRAKRSGLGDGSSVGRTGKPPPRSTVSNVSIEPRHRAASDERLAHRVAPRVDRAELRPDVEVDAARPERAVGAATGLDGRRRSPSRSCRTCVAPAPTARPVSVSGATSGLSRYRTSMRGASARRRRHGERLGLLGRLEGDPAQRLAVARGARGRGAQVGRRLADPLERDPLVRDAGAARQRPLAARHDVRPEAARGDGRDHGRDVVRLDRVLADDRVRETRRATSAHAASGSRGR